MLRKNYHCSVHEFKEKKLYNDSLKNAEIELITSRISTSMGITKKRAKFKLEQAESLLKIPYKDYYNKGYYRYTNYHLIEKLYDPTEEEKLNKMVDVVCIRLKCSREEGLEKIINIKNTYDIDISDIMRQCYYKATSDVIKERVNKKYGRRKKIEDYCKQKNVDFKTANNRIEELNALFGIKRKKDIEKYFNMENDNIFQLMDGKDEKRVSILQKLADESGEEKSVGEFYHDRELVTEAFGTTRKLYKNFKMHEKTYEEISTFILGSDMYYLINKYNRGNCSILENKLKFADFFRNEYGRELWHNDENATYESFIAFIEKINYKDLIVKPLNGIKGKVIEKIKPCKENIREIYTYLMSIGPSVIDECIEQHENMTYFGAGAVNTIRIVTILDKGQCHIVYAVLRVGMNTVVDNFHSGGYVARINKETGMIESNGYTLRGVEYINDPYSNEKIMGNQIPSWDEVIKLVTRSSKKIKEIAYVGWDIAISEKGPVLIEANHDSMAALIEFSYAERKMGHREIFKEFLDEE